MASGYQALTEKEKQTLRLLLAGHDAKSIARHLELSVHTINERLRDARRKLSVSSSREAARLLREAEGADPDFLGDKRIGDASGAPGAEQGGRPAGGSLAKSRTVRVIGGIVMISFALAMLALSLQPVQDRPQTNGAETSPAPDAESAVVGAARHWLSLVDAGKWQESWAATNPPFQSMNTLEMWQSASADARVPLGRVLARRLLGEESIPAPPHGYQLVRFRTDFANKVGATETLTLARVGDSWKVAGYFIE